MSKRKILKTLILYIILITPVVLYIYYPQIFPFDKQTSTEEEQTIEPSKPLEPDRTTDFSTPEGTVKSDLSNAEKTKIGKLSNINIETNTLTINDNEAIITDKTLLICYQENIGISQKVYDTYIDFGSLPKEIVKSFINASARSNLAEKKEFISKETLNKPVYYAYLNNSNELDLLLVFTDRCGNFAF